MSTAQMFQVCVLPGCEQLVAEVGETCEGCLAAFGSFLQLSPAPRLTEQQIAERDQGVRAAYAQQRALMSGPSR